jgi:hypothetical protein
MKVVLGVALAGQVDYLVTGNLSDYPAECRGECAVVSPAQFIETWRKGNKSPARSLGRAASGGNMTFCWTDPFMNNRVFINRVVIFIFALV